jgi:hypothetical protein
VGQRCTDLGRVVGVAVSKRLTVHFLQAAAGYRQSERADIGYDPQLQALAHRIADHSRSRESSALLDVAVLGHQPSAVVTIEPATA